MQTTSPKILGFHCLCSGSLQRFGLVCISSAWEARAQSWTVSSAQTRHAACCYQTHPQYWSCPQATKHVFPWPVPVAPARELPSLTPAVPALPFRMHCWSLHLFFPQAFSNLLSPGTHSKISGDNHEVKAKHHTDITSLPTLQQLIRIDVSFLAFCVCVLHFLCAFVCIFCMFQ